MKRRTVRWIAAGAGVVLLAVVAGIVVLTMTDFGRERVRLFSVGELEKRIQGRVEIERVDGNLLAGATLEGVSIVDVEGRPFLSADTVSLRYSIRSLFQKHLVFTDVRLVRPVVVFDQPPGGTWNVERIFPGDTVAVPGDTVPGFGDWVRIEDLTVVDGAVTVKSEWTPAAEDPDRAVAEALAPDRREMIASAPGGGFQSISQFHRVHGQFPLLRLADPDSAARVVDIGSLSMLALPFRPPAARIRDLEGRLTITEETLGLHDVRIVLPDSRLRIQGSYAFSGPERVNVQMRGDPVILSDFRWLRPSLPEGGGAIDLTVARDPDRTLLVARDMDLRVEEGRLEGFAEVETSRSGIRLERSDVRFEGLDTRTIERLGGMEVPVDGLLAGNVRLAGTTEELDVDGRVAIRERSGATSQIRADGMVVNRQGGIIARDLRLHFEPLQLTLARSVRPDVPLEGAVTGRATLNGPLESVFSLDADLVHRDPAMGRSHLTAIGEVRLVDGLEARDLRLRLDPLRTDLVRIVDPGFPVRGAVTGRTTIDGDLESFFTVDADLVHDAAEMAGSHILAEGDLRLADGVAARGLRVRMDPLRVALVRDLQPDLPLDGTLQGRVTLDGALASRITARDVDVTHRGSTGVSAVAGEVAVSLRDGSMREFDVDIRADPLSLATVGLFAPEAGLRGSGAAMIIASGTPQQATVRADLEVSGGGAVAARGTVGVGPSARYDLQTRLTRFDASAVTARAPATTLTGSADIVGVGTELASARARVDASLVDSEIEGTPGTDSTRIRARLEGGLAVVEEGRIRLAAARADVEGRFGLVAGRRGELRYSVLVDSLSLFPGLVSEADTGVVAHRPLPWAREVAAARADSARSAEDRLVESMATGRPPPPPPALDTAPPLPRDSVSGSVRAEGVVAGNVERFDVRGVAELEDVVLRGASVVRGTVGYEVLNAAGPEAMTVSLDADLDRVRVDGFAFSEATARLDHLGRPRDGSGRVEVDLVQDAARDYEVRADYDLARTELLLDRLVLRFDTTRWASTRPGIVRWAGEGVELDHIELANERGGRIFADGRLPDGEPGRLLVEVDSLQLAHVAALLQDTLDTRGLLSLDATVTGSLRSPLIEGTLAVDSLRRGEERIPAVRSTFGYADRELTARAEVLGEDRTLLEGDVRLPVDLALAGREGPWLLAGPVFADLRLDSLALEALPLPTDQVSDVRGRLSGDLSVRGSVAEPELRGDVELGLVSAHLVEPGITLHDGFGALRLRGRRIHVDSLVVHSGGGPVRVAGTVDVDTLTRPRMALDLTARDAVALDSEGDRLRVDLDLELRGPIREVAVEGEARVRGGEIGVPEPDRYRRVTRLDDPVLAEVLDTLEVAQQLRPGNPLLEHVRADVMVRIDRDTWLRNPDLSLEIYTPSGQPPLRLRTDPDARSFSILGAVHTDRGEYSFSGRQLELNSGSVTFLGQAEIDPLLQLNAQHEVPRRGRETLVILINVGGYLSEPRLTLSSNQQPPLPESDLLSYLAFGRESSSLLGSEGSGLMGDALGGLGVLAEQQLAGLGLGAITDAFVTGLERRGAGAGLDLFRVHPGAVPDELNYSGYFGNVLRGTEVEAGEYLGERFFILARTRLIDQTLPGLELEYRTPGGFSWTTTWDLRYLPRRPALGLQDVSQSRTFGSFLMWTRRW